MWLTRPGKLAEAGTVTPGGVTLARRSSLLTALQDLVKLEACRLNRFWKLKGTRRQLKPSSYTHTKSAACSCSAYRPDLERCQTSRATLCACMAGSSRTCTLSSAMLQLCQACWPACSAAEVGGGGRWRASISWAEVSLPPSLTWFLCRTVSKS